MDVLTNKLEIYKKANYQLRDEAFEQLEKENLDLLEQIHDMEVRLTRLNACNSKKI